MNNQSTKHSNPRPLGRGRGEGVLLLLLMLCCITTAWAGTGTGSKSDPFTGEWQASELAPLLKKGTHLAYDCEIKNGNGISVFDDKLSNKKIISNWSAWGVGHAITSAEPYEEYQFYYSLYSSEDRKDHTFVVTKVERTDNKAYMITGHYSGHYDRGDGTKENPYSGVWEASELGPKLQPGVYIDYYCVIKDGSVTVNDSKLNKRVATNWPAWSPGNLIGAPQSGSDYAQYGDYNPLVSRKNQSFILTNVSPSAKTSNEFVLTGYFSGFYYGIPEADSFIRLSN